MDSNPAGRRPKLFVLDTNVILHDANCILSFEENDIAIPIAVLEELDNFKKGNQDRNFQAREFLRTLDGLTGDLMGEVGAELGEGRGRIKVVMGDPFDPRLRDASLPDNADHRILSTSLSLMTRCPDRRVVLVSKDTNLRLKAKAFAVRAQDYTTDKVRSFDELYTGTRIVEGVRSEVISDLYQSADGLADAGIAGITEPLANENFVLRNGSSSALASWRAGTETNRLIRVSKPHAFGIKPRNAEQCFALSALLDESIRLVTLAGRAGTGKTLLALAAALENRVKYRQILLARPVVPLSNKDLGFLPGDIDDKLGPYMQPLFDNLAVIRHEHGETESATQQLQRMQDTGKLEVSPLSYIRGRSLQRVFFIVDEAQNLTPHEVKTIITRAGEGTKIVLTGDIHQIDHPYLDGLSNGLSYLIHRMMGQSLYAHVTLEKGERSELADVASELL